MFYFVSTPIGNLGDISFRAVEVLKSVDVIACEDTRTSLKLLNRYDVKKPLVSYHKFNERARAEEFIKEYSSVKDVAIISDAGTPVISDPGNLLTTLLKERDIPFTVIPGATALIPALMLSGFDASRFAFIGFLPEKRKDAEELLARYKNLDLTLVFYSAPHDLDRDIGVLYACLGNRRAAAVKEITKLHERAEIFSLADGLPLKEPKGEFVIVVEGGKDEEDGYLKLSVKDHLNEYISRGMDKKEAVKLVAKERNIPKAEVYKFTFND